MLLVVLLTTTTTPTLKNRVWGFENILWGRISKPTPQVVENASGSVAFTYAIALGQVIFLTRDPIGPSLISPKDKWFLDGNEVSYRRYRSAFGSGMPETKPSATAKDSAEDNNGQTYVHEKDQHRPGSISHYHIAVAGAPNIYTYVNQNPWSHFDPEGLDVDVPKKEDRPKVIAALQKIFHGKITIDENGKVHR